MKKALVTGATGFIGRFLVRELIRQGVEVIAIVREGSKNLGCLSDLSVRVVECDISRYYSLADKIQDRDIDTVFHTAEQSL